MPEQIVRSEKMLGAVLRRARREQGLTQSALGERTSMRQATVSRLEAGEPAIQVQTVMSVLSALNLEFVVRPRTRSRASDIESLF